MLDFYTRIREDSKVGRQGDRYKHTRGWDDVMEQFPNFIKHCRGAELLTVNAELMDDML